MTHEQECGMHRLIVRFPHLRKEIVLAYVRMDVRALCGAYGAACHGAEFWSKRDGARAALILSDYLDIILQLEDEIQDCLQKLENRTA
jgi:hypothetical protein